MGRRVTNGAPATAGVRSRFLAPPLQSTPAQPIVFPVLPATVTTMPRHAASSAPLIPRLSGAVSAIRALAGGRITTPGGLVLAYHDVVPGTDDLYDYAVTAEQFRDHLDWVTAAGLRIAPLAELVDRLVEGRPLDGLVAIAFDDCLEGVRRHAAPVLLERGLPATLFAVSDVLGRHPVWWPDAGLVMSAGALAELADAGLAVGAHTRTHPSLPALAPAALRDEVAGSGDALADSLGRRPELFAYPFGHHDDAVRAAVAEAGYRAGFSFLNGRVTAGLDLFRLPRLNAHAGLDRPRLLFQLARPAASWPDHQAAAVHGATP